MLAITMGTRGYDREETRKRLTHYLKRQGKKGVVSRIAEELGVTRHHVTNFREGRTKGSYDFIQGLGSYLDRAEQAAEGVVDRLTRADPPIISKLTEDLETLIKILVDQTSPPEARMGVVRSHLQTLQERIDKHLGLQTADQRTQEPVSE